MGIVFSLLLVESRVFFLNKLNSLFISKIFSNKRSEFTQRIKKPYQKILTVIRYNGVTDFRQLAQNINTQYAMAILTQQRSLGNWYIACCSCIWNNSKQNVRIKKCRLYQSQFWVLNWVVVMQWSLKIIMENEFIF